jgi:hypothetical protein
VRLLEPLRPPYDPLAWARQPLAERGRAVCEAWAMQGYGTPLGVFLLYGLKIALYVLGWALACGTSPSLGGLDTIGRWWLEPLAFQKAIVWSALFEVLGLGCGSGPLTGRYLPPIGGALYFLRVGTTKLSPFAGAPLVGGDTRGALDVTLYAALLVALAVALVAPTVTPAHAGVIVLVLALAGARDKTIVLAFRAEHYAVTLLVFALAPTTAEALAGAQGVQLALWFFAGFSKLNHHFPTVVCVMTSNGPLTPWGWLRRAMYRDFPRDVRPSRLATWIGHGGTALELGVPILFVLTPSGQAPVAAVIAMFALHLYILSNIPMGVPLEWNVMVMYGALALFWAHPDLSFSAAPAGILALVGVVSWLLPVIGIVWPARVSFLWAMRYYAGNWPCSIWLFRGDSYRKLDRLTKSAPWVHDQLAPLYDRATAVGLVGKVMGFRLMHLHGRALPLLVPRAVDDLAAYEWVDGELVAGLALGWNFGDGHLHHEQLLAAIQRQCGFEPGELRCIFLEGQPIQRQALAYRIADAATGPIEAGELPIAELRTRQPWSATAEAPR